MIKKQPQVTQQQPQQKQQQPYQNFKKQTLFSEKTIQNSTENYNNKQKNFKAKTEMDELGLLDDDDDDFQLNDDNDDEFLALIEMNSNKIKTPVPMRQNVINNEDNFSFNRNVQPIKRQSSFSERLNQNFEYSTKKPKSYHSTNDGVDASSKIIKANKPVDVIEILNDDDDDEDFLLVDNILKFEQLKPAKPTIKIDSLVDFAKGTPRCCIASSSCVHLVKGFIRTLTAPLKKVDMKWYQKCLISDGAAHLDVYIDDVIITDFMQLSCKQAKELFQKSREDPKILKIYENKANVCACTLAHVSGLMHLKYDKNKSEFCVFKFEDVDDSYFNYLIYKVKTSKN